MDTLFFSSKIGQNYDNIKWKSNKNWKLINGLDSCGYILYKHYIITFGGQITSDKRTDVIYILNMKDNNNLGWTELKHIKCPIASQYCAILDSHNNVRLFTKYNEEYVIKLYSSGIINFRKLYCRCK